MTYDGQQELPIQPVAQPILNNPYDEPTSHWVYDEQTGAPSEQTGRRDAFYWYKTEKTGTAQTALFTEESRDDLPLVNRLRADVRRWRESGYEAATPVTKQLLRHWSRDDLPRRLFFCQREAVETVVYLTEILGSGRKPRFTPQLSREDFDALTEGKKPQFAEQMMGSLVPTVLDQPADRSLPGLRRYGSKMATGSGKTVVMAMLISWAFCNRHRNPTDERFPAAALIVCPNLTVKERLQVLRPDRESNYYDEFDVVPSTLRDGLHAGDVLVTNWHNFLPESPHKEGDNTYRVVNKGEESPEAFAKKRLGDLADAGPIMVLNDEAHHAYRPKSMEERAKGESKDDWEEATVWVSGLDQINAACGVAFCVDLSATPFYLQSSGYAQGTPFPWIVSDFGLVDAIESGITKVPRLPVSDTTGRPEPKYFALWDSVMDALQPGEKLPGGKPKPDAAWREAEDAVQTLASQWKERFDYYAEAAPGQENVPPVMIVVLDNTDLAQLFYEKISGERVEDGETVYGPSAVRPEFANTPGQLRTVRIDSKLLAEAESEDPSKSKSDVAEALRRLIATVGEVGQPGEQVRCVVSVQMLTEGWDANNVTHILGLRAFRSQLLSEQVVGRGLRRMDYTPDPETGRLTEEYVDVYGIPFSVIPFRGREKEKKAPEDKPKQHVVALEERSAFEIRFPIVEGYAFALKQNLIRADVGAMEEVVVAPDLTPTAAFVKPQVGYQTGTPAALGQLQTELQDRRAYYETTHLQTIQFEIARQIVDRLTVYVGGDGEGAAPKLKGRSRHQLFPQVYALVEEYVRRKVRFRDVDPRELGLERYTQLVIERLLDAIEPDDAGGEAPLLPVLNRYRPTGSTASVNFKTTRPCYPTMHSHVNQVVADTRQWEQAAAFRLEQAALEGLIQCYVKNDGVEMSIAYEFLGTSHAYFPDFLVRLADGSMLIIETKGRQTEQDRAKHEAAQRWCRAVSRWGQLGHWRFIECRDPQILLDRIRNVTAFA
ncbi:hypothetical protein B1759_14245 [Rubrivirga sp. SAORIC476]|uniref:BPTD_3080 family restriction endonuclease n=1 Tax=Rubrivirga sp. SAORIC476 TaxID=1961794 RepID=UPI000BA8F04D|nr:DEAD/DEAH box helicase family protein [Rubrivirga sp. SAORIC476]PAP79480.1 hypothetical protein B1759_14245 [Rubrivirga sp. SAORIC476]